MTQYTEQRTEQLIEKAYAAPNLRQNIRNSGTIFLYSDYAGFAASDRYAAACCAVYNRSISVHAKKLPIDRDLGSNYGELKAIEYSLETLANMLAAHSIKAAAILTDCRRISRLLVQERFAHPHDEQARDELLTALAHLHRLFPEVNVQIRYIGKHKRNNHLHRLAHDAARNAALYPQ